MGFLDRAKAKAEELAEKAKPAAENAREKAKPMAEKLKDRSVKAAGQLKETAENFREGLQGKDDEPGGDTTGRPRPKPHP